MTTKCVKIPWSNERVIETINSIDSRCSPQYKTRQEVLDWLEELCGSSKFPWADQTGWTWYESTRQGIDRTDGKYGRPFRLISLYREFVFADPQHAMLFKLTWA